MQVAQAHLKQGLTDQTMSELSAINPKVLLTFADVQYFTDGSLGKKLKKLFPETIVVGCSTAGEIVDSRVYLGTMVLTAINTDCQWALATTQINGPDDSFEAGRRLGDQLSKVNPKTIFVLAPGLQINGSNLVDGLVAVLGRQVDITGGLAGDGTKFTNTYTLVNDAISNNQVIALAMHGGSTIMTTGVEGGWNPFGPYREVTKAENNILYELDGKPALELYKEYLGDLAKDLPGSGLLYPLNVIPKNFEEKDSIVRSIVNIDNTNGSIILAGDVAMGDMARLMHAKTESLVAGAKTAAESSLEKYPSIKDSSLGILVSCIGRRIVMGDDVDDEVGAVKDTLGSQATLTGFYSYGEICPSKGGLKLSRLHNQTMTIMRILDKSHGD